MGIQDCEPAKFQPSSPTLEISVTIPAAGTQFDGPGGTILPGIVAYWEDPENAYLLAVEFHVVRTDGEPGGAESTFIQPVEQQIWGTTDKILPACQYAVRFRAVGLNEARGPWSSITTVTTPNKFVAQDTANVAGVPADTLTADLANAVELTNQTKVQVDDLTEVVQSATGEFSQALILVGQQVEAAEDAASASNASATAAANSAGEGLTYRNQASEARDGAVSARDETRTAASTAQGVAMRLMPDRPSEVDDFQSLDDPGHYRTPEQTVPMTMGTNVTTSDQGIVRQFNNEPTTVVLTRGWKKVEAGRTYRFMTIVKVVTGQANNAVRQGFVLYSPDGIPKGFWFESAPATAATGWVIYNRTISGSDLLAAWPEGVYLRPWVQSGITSDGAAVADVVWQVSTLRAEDVTESAAAAGYAATALAQSSSASESAAEASISASIAASVGNAGQNLLPNSTALAELKNWNYWYGVSGILADPTAPDGSRFIWFVPGTGNYDAGYASDPINYGPGIQTSISAEVYTHALTSGAVRVYIAYFDSSNDVIDYLVAEAYGTNSQWVKVKRDGDNSPPSPAGTSYIRVYIDTYAGQWSAGGVAAWRKIKVENGPKATAWNDYANDRMVSAQLAITAKTTAGSTGQVLFDVTGGAGGDPFNIELKAGPGASSATMTASKVALKNIVDGTIVDALELQGGNAVLRGNLTAGGGIYLGSGTVWAVALRPQTFARGDGETISFGGANIGIPTYEFMRDNLLPLAAGESYDLQIKNLTAAGGTVWAKISVPGTPSEQTLAGPGTVPGSGPTRQNVKTPKPDSVSGNYTITLGGTYSFRIFGNTEWQDYEGSVSVGIFAQKAGVWTRVGALTANWYTNANNPSSVNITEMVYWETVDTVQMGEGIEAFGATIESSSGPLAGRAVVLNSLGPISWSSPGTASGTKSALASGAKTSIKITPQG